MNRIPGIAFAGSCAFEAAASAAPARTDVPRWISVMPTPNENTEQFVADVALLCGETVVDSVAYSCTLVPEGEPAVDKAAIYSERISALLPKVRKAVPEIRQGILLQATMGHGWSPNVPNPWQKVVRNDGAEMYKFCPLNLQFLDFMESQARRLGRLGADFFMLDDDTRLITGVNGCYCPLHLAEFARRTGVKRTREQVIADCAADTALAAQWDRLLADSIVMLAERIRRAFPESMPGIFCCCSLDSHHAGRIARVLAAPGQRPFVRLNCAPYLNRSPFDNVSNICNLMIECAAVGEGVGFLCEADTCPQVRYSTSARRWLDYMELSAFSGIKGAKIWLSRIGNPQERSSAIAYRQAFTAESGLIKALDAFEGTPTGVVVPTPFAAGVKPGMHRDWVRSYLSQLGVSCRVGAWRQGETVALAKDDIGKFTDEELRRFLSGSVLLDGAAALELTRRGFASLIGVEAVEWKFKPVSVHEFVDGTSLISGASGADLTKCDPRAEETVKFYHKQSALSSEKVYLAPGAIRFVNSSGGRVAVFSGELPSKLALGSYGNQYYTETYKREVVSALKWLGSGKLPGGVYYTGDAPVWCQTAVDSSGSHVAMFDNLELDPISPLPLAFDKAPKTVERLQDDGSWRPVAVSRADGVTTIDVTLTVMRPVFLRFGY